MPTTTLPGVFALARLADCADPDSASSPGGRWLLGIAEGVAERCHDEDRHDLAHEIADSAVPVYTADLFAVLVDLAAYREDVADLVDAGDDLTRRASLALYVVAERLALALLDEA
jgi:hypothetical protein